MDIIVAAKKTERLISHADRLPDSHPAFGYNHLWEMADKIVTGEVTGEKAHRWLGWIQACVCFGGGATLEELKQINKKA